MFLLKQKPPSSTVPPEPQPTQKSSQTFQFPWKRCVIAGGILATLGFASLVKVPNDVNAEGQLRPKPKASRPVYMEVPGTVTQFLVEPGEVVKKGDKIAEVVTPDLDKEIIAKQTQLQERESALARARQQVPILESRLQESYFAEQAAQKRMMEVKADYNNSLTSGGTPEMRRLEEERRSLNSRISGIEGEIVSLKEQLDIVNEAIRRYKEAMAEIAEAIGKREFEEQQNRRAMLTGNLHRKQEEIHEIRNQMAAKTAEIEMLQKNLQRQMRASEDELAGVRASRLTVSKQLEAARADIFNLTKLLKIAKEELSQLTAKQAENKTLETPISGLVASQDLYERQGRKMQENESVLEIADIKTLDVLIEVPQANSRIVREQASVTVRFQEPGLSSVPTQIYKIEPIMRSDETRQKQLLLVRAEINNVMEILKPGAQVYAQIKGEKIPLYRKVQWELAKLFKLPKYGVGQ
ncbi:MAG: efflux RND transporter periplasmic adaptor subunit [Cyanobacteria bacterium P01_E01_bin.42]